jgi:Ribbon-helix-helix protein, copG family
MRPLSTEYEGGAPRVSVRIGPADLDRLTEAAKRRGVKVSTLLRDAALQQLDTEELATA